MYRKYLRGELNSTVVERLNKGARNTRETHPFVHVSLEKALRSSSALELDFGIVHLFIQWRVQGGGAHRQA